MFAYDGKPQSQILIFGEKENPVDIFNELFPITNLKEVSSQTTSNRYHSNC